MEERKRELDAATRLENIAKKKRNQEQVEREFLGLQAAQAPKRTRGGGPDTPADMESDEEDDGYSDGEGKYEQYPNDAAESTEGKGSWKYIPPANSPLGKSLEQTKELLTDEQKSRSKTDYQDGCDGKLWWSLPGSEIEPIRNYYRSPRKTKPAARSCHGLVWLFRSTTGRDCR